MIWSLIVFYATLDVINAARTPVLPAQYYWRLSNLMKSLQKCANLEAAMSVLETDQNNPGLKAGCKTILPYVEYIGLFPQTHTKVFLDFRNLWLM